MLHRIDPSKEERIRRWPVWFARLANGAIGWTDETCSAGCGYPVTRQFEHEVESFDGRSVVMGVCSVDSKCEEQIRRDPRDGHGVSYADLRPQIVEAVRDNPEIHTIRLTRTV